MAVEFLEVLGVTPRYHVIMEHVCMRCHSGPLSPWRNINVWGILQARLSISWGPRGIYNEINVYSINEMNVYSMELL